MLKNGLSVHYAFTITLRPKLFLQEPEVQYDMVCEYVRKKLSSLCYSLTLIVEKTKAYNVHMHGICNFSLYKRDNFDCMKEFHKCFRSDTLVGFVNIRQIDDMVKWKEYIKKDISATCTALNRRPILTDDYDVFNEEERANYGIIF